MPPGFFQLSSSAQQMYLWLQLPADLLDALCSWKPGVHKGIGVCLPRDIEYTLSMNLKFLFPGHERKVLAYEWFEDLVRKCRLRVFFQGKQEKQEFLPDLPFVKNPSFNPEVTDTWFTQGVRDGRRRLQLHLDRSIPDSRTKQTSDVFQRLLVSAKHLQGWLTERSLLCFISDKNLGIVVTTKQWYEEQVQKFLDLPIFEPFHENWQTFHETCCDGLENLSVGNTWNVSTHSWITPRCSQFLLDCWYRTDIPRFHGIPKIHKDPWKLRPIVPMHSYVTSPLATVLHHLLLPVQRQYSWICESSRNLVRDVARFNRKMQFVRLHTGDVSAMYTSIKWPRFRDSLVSALIRYKSYSRGLMAWIMQSAEFVWNNTVFQFGKQLLRQTDGVPMGLACGPVFANIYMAEYEYTYLQGFTGLYRRYIDDIFVLHRFDAVVEDLAFVPNLDITWAHSGEGISFLDVWFHVHWGIPDVCYRPFEKALNNKQYLPWASSHPISVKKGLVKGELTRTAAISRHESYFRTWKGTFLSRLRMRGWPVAALRAWSRQVTWHAEGQGLGTSRKSPHDVVIAASEYNPVWEKVSSADIWEVMQQTWHRLGPRDVPVPAHCLVARKRTRSMWDLLRSVNRNLLQQDIEETPTEDLDETLSALSLDVLS